MSTTTTACRNANPSEIAFLRSLVTSTRFMLRIYGHPIGFANPIALLLDESCKGDEHGLDNDAYEHYKVDTEAFIRKFEPRQAATALIHAIQTPTNTLVQAFDMQDVVAYATSSHSTSPQKLEQNKIRKEDTSQQTIQLMCGINDNFELAFGAIQDALQAVDAKFSEFRTSMYERYGIAVIAPSSETESRTNPQSLFSSEVAAEQDDAEQDDAGQDTTYQEDAQGRHVQRRNCNDQYDSKNDESNSTSMIHDKEMNVESFSLRSNVTVPKDRSRYTSNRSNQIFSIVQEYQRRVLWLHTLSQWLSHIFVFSNAAQQLEHTCLTSNADWSFSNAQWYLYKNTKIAYTRLKELLAHFQSLPYTTHNDRSVDFNIILQYLPSFNDNESKNDTSLQAQLESQIVSVAQYGLSISIKHVYKAWHSFMDTRSNVLVRDLISMQRLQQNNTKQQLQQYFTQERLKQFNIQENKIQERNAEEKNQNEERKALFENANPVNMLELRELHTMDMASDEITNELSIMSRTLRETSLNLTDRLVHDNKLLDQTSDAAATNLQKIEDRRGDLALRLSGAAHTFGGTCLLLLCVTSIWVATYLLIKIVPPL